MANKAQTRRMYLAIYSYQETADAVTGPTSFNQCSINLRCDVQQMVCCMYIDIYWRTHAHVHQNKKGMWVCSILQSITR